MSQVPEPAAGALTVEQLSVRYGAVRAVKSVSLTVPLAGAVSIIGANGAGKTSTLKALMGLVPRDEGRIRLGEQELTRVRARDMVRHGIGYVPEGRRVFSGLSVEKNLLLGGYVRSWGGQSRGLLERVYGYFPMLGEMRARPGGALSGGQQQMLAIGRALMSQPRLILFDEPSMGLSPKLVDGILEILRRLRAEGLSLLLVEQNAGLAFEATDRCLVMENGEVVISGTCDELRDDARVRRSYLGL